MPSIAPKKFAVAAALCISAVPAFTQWQVQSLHPAGAVFSAAWGADDGKVCGVVSYVGAWSYLKATLWEIDGAMTDLHPTHLGGTVSAAYATSGNLQAGQTYYADPNVGGPQFASRWQNTALSCFVLDPVGYDAYASDGTNCAGVRYIDDISHAAMWGPTPGTWTDLNPNGSQGSIAWGTVPGQQVGAYLDGMLKACLWNDSAATWVDLHPDDAEMSRAYGTDGVEQAGATVWNGVERATLWRGTPESCVDLQPDDGTSSYAYDVEGGYQVGAVWKADGRSRASIWNGTKESWEDLDAMLPPIYSGGSSNAWAIWVDGANIYVAGDAMNSLTGQMEAILWTLDGNEAPIANAGPDQTVTIDPESGLGMVMLNGSLSSDPDGDELTYQWYFPWGDLIGDTAVVVTQLSPGVHTLTLVVTDPSGLSNTDEVVVTVAAANRPPVADAGADISVAVPHDGSPLTNAAPFTLNGSGSDPDGDSLTYRWSWNGNAFSTYAVSPHEFPAGTYTFTLRVTDPAGLYHEDQVTVTISPEPNAPPVANAGPDRTFTLPPGASTFPVTLDGSASADPDGDAIQCRWLIWQSFGNNFKFFAGWHPVGTYSRTLEVMDSYGAIHTDLFTYTVVKAPGGSNLPGPRPQDDDYETQKDTQIIIEPLLNDSHTDGDTMTIIMISYNPPVIVDLGGGKYRVTPPFPGMSQLFFPYWVMDSAGRTATAMIKIKYKK